MSYIVFNRINPFCNRDVYFVIDGSLDYKSMNIYQLYDNSVEANFNRKESARIAIKLNLKK